MAVCRRMRPAMSGHETELVQLGQPGSERALSLGETACGFCVGIGRRVGWRRRSVRSLTTEGLDSRYQARRVLHVDGNIFSCVQQCVVGYGTADAAVFVDR